LLCAACGAASRRVGGDGHVGLVPVSERKPYKTDVSDEQWARWSL